MYVADLRRSLDVLGPKLVQIFGQGESPMTITSLARDDHLDAHLPTCGRARTLVDVRVVDADDRELRGGRDRRDRHPQRLRDARLLEQSGGERRVAARRMAAHRRSRQPRRARLPHAQGSREGHDHLRRIQHLSARDRGSAAAARRRAGGVRRRTAASRLGRRGRGLCRGAPRRERGGRRARPAVPRSHRALQAAARDTCSSRACRRTTTARC